LKIRKNHWLIVPAVGRGRICFLKISRFFTRAHKYTATPLQVALECGILGVIVLLFLILSGISLFLSEYRYRRNTDPGERILQAALFAGIAGLLIHSFFDFDFSLSAVFLLFWQMLGIFNARYRNSTAGEIIEHRKPITSKILGAAGRLTNIKKLNTPAAVILTASLVLLFIPAFINTAKDMQKKPLN
jgi:O-antigen ligase